MISVWIERKSKGSILIVPDDNVLATDTGNFLDERVGVPVRWTHESRNNTGNPLQGLLGLVE